MLLKHQWLAGSAIKGSSTKRGRPANSLAQADGSSGVTGTGQIAAPRTEARKARSGSPAADQSSAQRSQAVAATVIHSASARPETCRLALSAASAQRIA